MNLTKLYIVCIILVSLGITDEEIKDPAQSKIQIAFLLDTSGSMDQLLYKVKSQFWRVATYLSTAMRKKERPVVEYAIMTYGMEHEKDFSKVVTDFSTDLDSVAWKLSQIPINGSTEHCWTTINKALTELSWSNETGGLRLIIIAGNEYFNQENYDYKKVTSLAEKMNVVINMIYCEGVNHNSDEAEWKGAAKHAKGNYFSISLRDSVNLKETVYDGKLVEFNEKLNATYVPFGINGDQNYARMILQDATARMAGAPTFRERILYKVGKTFKNSSWDLVDAFEADSTMDLNPERLEAVGIIVRDKTEALKLIAQKRYQRESYKQGIRLRYELIRKYTGEQPGDNDLDLVLQKIIHKEGSKLGYEFEKPLDF